MALVLPHSIFIHIPKTGGSWVREVIRRAKLPHKEVGPPGVGPNQKIHCTVRGLPKHYRKGRLIFACIRHPVAWLRSRWAYSIKHGKLNPANKRVPFHHLLHKDINVFLERLLAKDACLPTHAMLRRIGWEPVNGVWKDVLKKKDRVIGRTESLVNDFIEFLRRAGEKFDAGVIRRTHPVRVTGKKTAQQISPELSRRVCDANQVLMQLGGY